MNYFIVTVMLVFSLPEMHTPCDAWTLSCSMEGAGKWFRRSGPYLEGLACADCHEGRGFSSALFDMKKGADSVT